MCYCSYWEVVPFLLYFPQKSCTKFPIWCRDHDAEEFGDISDEYELEDDNYISSDGDGEIDETVSAFDISDEDAED